MTGSGGGDCEMVELTGVVLLFWGCKQAVRKLILCWPETLGHLLILLWNKLWIP